MPDTPPCGLPHHTWPETVCTEPAGHYRPDVDPHAAPLIIDGRHRGGCAWDEPDATGGTMPEPTTPPETTEAELRLRLDTIRARMAPPGPTPDRLAAGDAEDRALVPRIHAARPGVPTHHIFATLQTLRALRDWEAAKEPTTPAPGLRDLLLKAVDEADGHSCAYQEGIDAGEITDAVLAVVQPVIDEVDLLRRGAAERADLLEEARDALSAAGQNGAHGDDWPNIAPSIRALGERAADLATRASQQAELLAIAEHAGNTAEAARAEAARRAETAEAAIARVRDALAQCHGWGETGDAYYTAIKAALTPPAPADQTEGEGT